VRILAILRPALKGWESWEKMDGTPLGSQCGHAVGVDANLREISISNGDGNLVCGTF
jgi:hypothetical protein